MGTVITLSLGGIDVDWAKNHRGTDHGSLFQPADRRTAPSDQIDYDYFKESGEDPSEMERAFMRPLKSVVPRLELLGFTIDAVGKLYDGWVLTLQHALSDTLGSLIDTYGKAVRDHGPPVIGNFNSLVDRLRDAARLRNVLCHGAWSRKPDAEGRSVPFYVSGIGQKQMVFESPIDIAYLQQTQQATVELAYEVINSVALMGWQFPGSTGPGIPLWPSAMSS